MPLHGKIVVVKRSGGDGTEFPLTATCLFGRKPDCDIRIQLPQVSKEHCRIDLNENKEVVLTNLSSVNPTRVNGEALQQSERLKHGDVITIIDRSFRFEYPPAPTPKKRSSIGGKTESFKVLQDQQVGDTVSTETGEKKISEVSTDPHLKDGTNHDNIQRSLEKTMELESKEENKTASPFNDLYQMIKKSLDVKTPQKSSASLLQTPTSRFCTPKPGTVRKNDGKLVTEEKGTPKKVSSDENMGMVESGSNGTPKSVKKQRKSFQVPSTEMARPEAENDAKSDATSPQKRNRVTPQKFTVSEVIEQVQTPKSPMRRRSKEATPAKASPKPENLRTSPRNSGKVEKVKETSKKRKSGELGDNLPTSQMKKKRVSFGGHLSPELFDKRMPPDSPLRKGAAPRRSLCLYKPRNSLLRRASVIGLLQESEHTPSPKKSVAKNASPKAASPGKKSPKSKSTSPKAATPAKKSPKSRTPSPKAATPAKKSPKSRTPSPKAATPATKSPKSRPPSPKAATPAKKSLCPSKNKVETPGVQTPTVQGRFSVSRISTPSPIAEDVVIDQMPLVTVTPKIPLRRKSMKSKTPSMVKSAIKVMRRTSGISRASMKVKGCWANVVKFGQPKAQEVAQVAAPAKKTVVKKTMKKAVSKPQTPARKLKDYVSTGHADSPATIVVGRAHQQKVVYPTGAAPRLVANTALLKKNMKMDEDLTGISEMYKTPVNERKRRSVMKTPVVVLGTSVVEPSVLNTPEEPGEMMVSPLSVTSAVKDGRYSSEAVQRFLNEDQESSFIIAIPAVETQSDSGAEQCTHSETTSVATPKQKPEQHECLTGVKRIMKTPRQKAEPVEDLRGKILKTPKQKLEQQECLTGVKRIMKTPRQKAEPVEDLRGKILKTPKQKLEQQEYLSAVKRIFETPQRESEPLEDLQGKLLETPKALEAGDAGLDGVKEIVETPVCMQVSEDLSQMADLKTLNVKRSPLLCLTDVKRIMKTPKEKNAPVEDMVSVKRLMKTPKEKAEPVEKNFGLKRLMKSPRLRGNAPVEDFEGLQELMEEPLPDPTVQLETNEAEDQQDDVQMDVIDNAPQVDIEMANLNEVVEEVPSEHDNKESPDALETISQVDAVDEIVAEEQPKVETSTGKVSEIITTMDSVHEKKSVRGRRAKVVETKSAEDKEEATEQSEEPVVPAPVRGKRVKKTEATAPPAVKQTRGRNATVTESKDFEMEKSASLPSEVAIKPKRGRNAKKASDDQAEIVQEVATENMPEAESEQSPPVYADHEKNDSTASTEKAVLKPKRGRKAKQSEQTVTEQQDVPQADTAKEDANEGHTDQLQGVPGGSDENESSDAPATEVETAICEVTEMDAAPVSKKSVRGRRAKVVESKPIEDKQDVTEQSEEPVITAPVRGRRGKKTEATAPPAVKQTRGRNAKSQQSAPDQPEMVPEKVVEATLPEISTEAVSDQISPVNTQEETDSAPPAEEAVVKPTRGRKTKAPIVPPQSTPEEVEVVSDEHLIEDAQPQKSIPKPRRGRKAKPDTVEQNEVAEDTVVVETKQSQPPVRAKRGRNAKQEEEKLENDDKATSGEAAKSQEPVKKSRRTRKAEQDHVEPTEVQAVEVVVPEEAEAPVVTEPVKTNEQATVPTKLRRGGRKAKQDTESETPVDSTEVQEVPAVSSTDKPKRGRRGKQVTEDAEVSAVVPEEKPDHEPEAEEKNNTEVDAPVVKSSRARGVKNEVSQAIPAKRGRRGVALPLEETNTESTVPVSEPESAPLQPAKRGRRAAAKATTDDATVSSDQANPTEDLSNAAVEDTQTSKRSVKWKANLEVFEIPKATPVKAVRGRKSKLADQVDTESKTEEKDLSEVVAAQPAKRARRGAKVADEAESTSEVQCVEPETQPKTRRGRSAKK